MNHKTLANIAKDAYDYAAFNIGECEAIIKYYDDVQVVAFRGTETGAIFDGAGWVDVVRDLRVIPWYDKDTGWVHAGFLKGAQRASDFLASKLDKSLPVIMTGHSMGGALSLMTACKLQGMGFKIKEWVGFGSPKCQFSTRQYAFKQTNYRYRADIVTLMPRLPFYRHNYMLICLDYDPDIEPNWHDHAIEFYMQHART